MLLKQPLLMVNARHMPGRRLSANDACPIGSRDKGEAHESQAACLTELMISRHPTSSCPRLSEQMA